jgi:hypothetical protein
MPGRELSNPPVIYFVRLFSSLIQHSLGKFYKKLGFSATTIYFSKMRIKHFFLILFPNRRLPFRRLCLPNPHLYSLKKKQ